MKNANSYRPDIDGLRALAVISVVMFHLSPQVYRGGFIGVDIFFVISGFLITNHIIGALSANTFSFKNFYIKRIKRIFPALGAMMLGSLLLGWYVLLPQEYQQLSKHVLSSIAFISNLTFWSESGYFDNAFDTKPLLNLWSLGVEEQFYIVWPVVLLLTAKLKARFLFVVAIIWLISFVLNLCIVNINLVAAFFSPMTRFWELLCGAFLSHWVLKKKVGALRNFSSFQNMDLIKDISSVVGLIFIALGLVLIREGDLFPGGWALLPTLGASLIIISGPDSFVGRKILSHRLLTGIGLISYPIYIFHWPILVFAKILYGDLDANFKMGIVLITIAISFLFYKLIERPIRKSSSPLIAPLLIFFFFIIGLFSFFIYKSSGLISHDANYEKISKDFDWPSNLKFTKACQNKYFQGQYCLVHNIDKTLDVAIFGDSQANTMYWGLSDYLSKNKINSINIGFGGCYPFYEIVGSAHPTINYHCYDKVHRAYEFLIKNKDIKTVYFSFHHAGYFSKDGKFLDNLGQIQGPDMERNIGDALIRSIQYLKKHGKVVILIYDMPSMLVDPRMCVVQAKLSSRRLICDESLLSQDFGKYDAVLERVAKESPVKVLRTHDFIAGNFPIGKDGQSMYRDKTHLSYEGSIFFSDKYEMMER